MMGNTGRGLNDSDQRGLNDSDQPGLNDSDQRGLNDQLGRGHADDTDWHQAHEALLNLANSRAGLDFEEGRWLVLAHRYAAHARLGYGSFAEYVERLFGYCPRLTYTKLRVAEALATLPRLAQALRDGRTNWSALRELTRVATPETEGAWLTAAHDLTVRQVERLVSGHVRGDRPGDAARPEARRHVLRLEVSSDVLTAFREAMTRLRRDAGEHLDDEAALLLMARLVLGGPKDQGRASYQVALTVCESCRRGTQSGSGACVDVGAEVVAMAACDAQYLVLRPAQTDPFSRKQADHDPSIHRESASRNAPAGARRPLSRAKQDVPPAVRRLVLRRDRGRCVFPGCCHATFLDLHHITARAAGGRHDPDNLVTVCGAHHRAIHRGEAGVKGSIAAGLRFERADGAAYGRAQLGETQARGTQTGETQACGTRAGGTLAGETPTRGTPATWAKAFRALCHLGFREGEARQALAQATTHVGEDADLESLVRRALFALTRDIAA